MYYCSLQDLDDTLRCNVKDDNSVYVVGATLLRFPGQGD